MPPRTTRAACLPGVRGASAIEWAIITGLLAMIALGVGVVIYNKVTSAANDIKTK